MHLQFFCESSYPPSFQVSALEQPKKPVKTRSFHWVSPVSPWVRLRWCLSKTLYFLYYMSTKHWRIALGPRLVWTHHCHHRSAGRTFIFSTRIQSGHHGERGSKHFAGWSLKELSQNINGERASPCCPTKWAPKTSSEWDYTLLSTKKSTILMVFYSEKGRFSWAMLVSERVTPVSLLVAL